MSGKVEPLKDEGSRWQVVGAGAIAGLVSRFVVAPLDVIKIRLQLEIHSLSDPLTHRSATGRARLVPHSGTLGMLKRILRDEGLTGLWKGNVPAELMYLCYGGVQFLSYRSASAFLQSLELPTSTTTTTPNKPRHIPDAATTFLAGAFAGTAATTATYPLDLLRTRFAASPGGDRAARVYPSLLGSLRAIARTEGPRGYFRGMGAAIAQIVPFMSLFFLAYEALKPAMATFPLLPGTAGDAAAGMVASVLAKTAVFPLDTVRKRLQVQGPTRTRYVHGQVPVYEGVRGTVRAILRREGVRGLYRGLPVGLFKTAPTSAVMMWTYERVMKIFLAMEERMKEEEEGM